MAKKKKKTRARAKRRTKDGNYVAVNVYMHVDVLDKLDQDATKEDRNRRAQLERVLCSHYGLDPSALKKGS